MKWNGVLHSFIVFLILGLGVHLEWLARQLCWSWLCIFTYLGVSWLPADLGWSRLPLAGMTVQFGFASHASCSLADINLKVMAKVPENKSQCTRSFQVFVSYLLNSMGQRCWHGWAQYQKVEQVTLIHSRRVLQSYMV